MVRLFVGVELPEDVRERLTMLCAGVPGARWVPPENLHLTLRFIGEVSGGEADDIFHALASVRPRRFDVTFSGVGHFDTGNEDLLKALIKKSKLFISNSTGPMHIAAALGVYVIGFFPKILSCSQNRWGPYTDKGTIYVPTIDCSNCTREQCEKLDCMNSIDIGKVFDETKRVLKIQL